MILILVDRVTKTAFGIEDEVINHFFIIGGLGKYNELIVKVCKNFFVFHS